MGERYAQTGQPRDLTCVFCASQGNAEGRATITGPDGMIAKIIGGHFGLHPAGKDMAENKCQPTTSPWGGGGIFRAAIQQSPATDKVVSRPSWDPRLEAA
jgi:propionate CoA-transferase